MYRTTSPHLIQSLWMTWLAMYVNYRDNLWTVVLPRKREEVVLTTKTNRILPRRDFGPSQTSTLHKQNQEQHIDVVVASSSKLKARENEEEQTWIQRGVSPTDRGSCAGKVYPTPDRRKVWLVTERQLPQGSVTPKVVFAALWARAAITRTRLWVHREQIEKSLPTKTSCTKDLLLVYLQGGYLMDEMIQLKMWEL